MWNPKRVTIQDVPDEACQIIERPLHPDFLERGERNLPFNGEVYLAEDDLKSAISEKSESEIKAGNDGKILRLMDAVNVSLNGENVIYHSQSFEEARAIKAQVVQWVPAEDNISAEVVMPDASIVEGFCEPDCRKLSVDDEVQLERFGFARVDEIKQTAHLRWVGHAGGVGQTRFIHTGFNDLLGHPDHVVIRHDALDGAAKGGGQTGLDLTPGAISSRSATMARTSSTMSLRLLRTLASECASLAEHGNGELVHAGPERAFRAAQVGHQRHHRHAGVLQGVLDHFSRSRPFVATAWLAQTSQLRSRAGQRPPARQSIGICRPWAWSP